jgi:MFS transporter, ACS family, glucarate transporter
MNLPATAAPPTNVRYGVLGFACVLSMITYLDRVCFGTVAPYIQDEFGLTETQKGWLFTAFALSYAAFEVPSGWLGDRFGARRTLIRIVLWWSVFTALTGSIYPTPSAPWLAFVLLIAVRFLFGMGEAGAYPNIARAFHSWFPFTERGSAKGAVWMAGRFAGGITAFIVYALMIDAVAADGTRVTYWRHTFYIFGALGIVWCVAWWWWYRDRPEEKPEVNAAEIALIQHGEDHSQTKLVVPWMKLLTSGNLWILCAMYFCAAYGWYLNITYLPGYLKDQLGIERGDQKWTAQFWTAGLMAGLPLLIGSVACLIGGLLTDGFIKRTGNRKWGRRLFGVVGHGLTACCFFAALFFMNSPWTFVLLIAFAAFWNDITMGSAWASCLDIGKRYSGIVAGCMNTVGNIGGAIAGVATGLILDWHTSGLARGTSEHAVAMNQGWTVNIAIFGTAYVIAVVCWLNFDATKPVVPVETAEESETNDNRRPV